MFLAASLAFLDLAAGTAAQAGVKISQLHYTRTEGSTPIEVESYVSESFKKKEKKEKKRTSFQYPNIKRNKNCIERYNQLAWRDGE